jgi:uncharacterized protein (UPF0264 family)
MQLLVSVADAADARAAVDGGADIVDTKDPAAGPLGAVTLEVFAAVRHAVGDRAPLSAALGDLTDARQARHLARAFATAGARYVKIGFGGVQDPDRVTDVLAAAIDGVGGSARQTGVVAVAYADAPPHEIAPLALIDIARRAGAAGILVDTADKQGAGLLACVPSTDIARWVSSASDAGLLACLAGRLTLTGVDALGGVGADIVGVRGAACDGGRGGRVSMNRVKQLHDVCVRAVRLAAEAAHVP